MRKPLTVLWFGAGQDSTALLYLYVYDAEWRRKYVGESKFLVVFSDTGNEYDETYNHIEEVKVFCRLHHIEFYHLTPDLGYHPETWPTLVYQMERNHTVFGVGFPKSCTDNLKITPCYNFLEQYIENRYLFPLKKRTIRICGTDVSVPVKLKRKQVFYHYLAEFGKLTSLIGFAKGEESRCAESNQTELFPDFVKDDRPKWMRQCVQHRYPLVEMGMSRADCQAYIKSVLKPVPIPSNCKYCPFQNEVEIVYMERFHPEDWNEWVRLERAKLDKNASKARNLGVKGAKTLPEYLEAAKRKYGHWSDEQLREYRNSHGHCVKSKY